MTRTQSGFHGNWRAISTTRILSELCACVCVCMCMCVVCVYLCLYVCVHRVYMQPAFILLPSYHGTINIYCLLVL